jgi:hypothetical protein
VKVFLSYPSEERPVVERVNHALVALGHDVFFDRADLEPGLEYDQAIGKAIDESDVFVFFITPRSVEQGRYTLTELGLAERKWPHASGRVLPVMARPTEIAAVPSYLRAVNIFTPRGDIVADTAHQVHRLGRTHPWPTRIWRFVRSPAGVATVAAIALLGGAGWFARSRGLLGDATIELSAAVRQNARAVAALADSGFVVAAANPPRLVRFSESGVQFGDSIELMGEPMAIARTPGHLIVVTRGRDGLTIFDSKRLRLVDSTILDPASVRPVYRFVNPPRRSGDIQSVAIFRGDPWVTTGDRDGEPTVLRYRVGASQWEVPTWVVDTAGFGPEAKGVRLRDINGELWGAKTSGAPSTLYHVVDFTRIDRFDGKDLKLVSCAHDVAGSPRGNAMFLSCDHELQEVEVQSRSMTLLRTWPPLPVERAPGAVMHHLFATDSGTVFVAVNAEAGAPNGAAVRAQVFAIPLDTSGAPIPLLNEPGATVRSLAASRRQVVAVLRRAGGSIDVVVRPRGVTPSP